MDSKRLAADYLSTALEAAKRKKMKARCFPQAPSEGGDITSGQDAAPLDMEALAAALAGQSMEGLTDGAPSSASAGYEEEEDEEEE